MNAHRIPIVAAELREVADQLAAHGMPEQLRWLVAVGLIVTERLRAIANELENIDLSLGCIVEHLPRS